MTVKCKAISPSEEELRCARANPNLNNDFQLTIGKEYVVLGILFVFRSPIYGSTTLFDVQDDFGFCYSVPGQLFEIVDPSPSKYWIIRKFGEEDLALWPEEFYRPFFHDRLSDGHDQEKVAFKDLVGRLTHESPLGADAPAPGGFKDRLRNY